MVKNLTDRQNVVRVLVYFSLAIPFVIIFTPFSVPMLLAAFFAFALEPIGKRIGLHRRNKKFFPFFLLIFSFLFLLVPLVLVGVKVTRLLQSFTADGTKNSQLFQSLDALLDKGYIWTTDAISILNLDKDIFPTKDEIISKISPIVVTKTTEFLAGIPAMGLSILVFFGVLIVIVPRAEKIKKFFMEIQILPNDEFEQITASIQRNCYVVLISTFLIGLLQAMIVAIGASLFGFHEFFLIFVITFTLSFIPVIGAAPMSFILAIAAFIMGNSGNGIGLLVVTVIAGSIDNIIKPYVVSSKEAGTHPIIALMGIIGAIFVFGLPGLLLGPLLLQLGTELLPKLTSRVLTALKL